MARKKGEPKGAPRTVREAVAVPPARPSSNSLVDHFFALAGGPAKVAKLLFDEFNAASAGSLIRQRILEVVFRNLRAAEGKNTVDDMGHLTQEDIDRLIDEKERAISATLAPRAPDADPGPVQPAGAGEGPPPADPEGPAA